MEIKASQFSKVMLSVSQALKDPNTGVGAALFNAGLIAASDMEQRVFQRGETITGEQLYYLSDRYKSKREKFGRQVDYKDFYFSGNLFNSLTFIETSNQRVVYGFSSPDTAEVAWGVTDQIGLKTSDVFGLSIKEREFAKEQFIKGVSAIINKAVKGNSSGIRKMQEPRKSPVKPYQKKTK